MKECCNHTKKSKKCIRKDKKIFKLPRKNSRKECINKQYKGFSFKSSCAPYKYCKKQNFLYNPNNPKKSFDVYIDKNPKDTIPIKYSTVDDVRNTIKKLEKLYKTKRYTHKRIWQVGMIMKVRLESMYKRKDQFKNAKNLKERYNLSKKYFDFLSNRTSKKNFEDRKQLTFISKKN